MPQAKQDLRPTVEQEIDALKKRIDELENEVKQARALALADSADTAALKAAEKTLVAGNGAAPKTSPAAAATPGAATPGFSSSAAGQEPAPAQAAAPAPAPEISAQTTTVWGPEYGNELEYLRTFVRQVRMKIEDDPAKPTYLLTESHIGYRFSESV